MPDDVVQLANNLWAVIVDMSPDDFSALLYRMAIACICWTPVPVRPCVFAELGSEDRGRKLAVYGWCSLWLEGLGGRRVRGRSR
jgi:hypothetical protein